MLSCAEHAMEIFDDSTLPRFRLRLIGRRRGAFRPKSGIMPALHGRLVGSLLTVCC
jgi:hypothetical protein